MTRYFISDLHLSNERPDLIRAFDILVHYLITQTKKQTQKSNHQENKTTPAKTELYILGDFYERWIGEDEEALWQQNIEHTLLRLLRNNIDVIFFHGNRDFLLNQKWAARIGVQLVEEQLVIEDSGCRILLSHGDEACLEDIEYQEFRTMVRASEWQQNFLAQPLIDRIALTTRLRKQSKAVKKAKSLEIMDVNLEEIARLMQLHESQLMIHGHTHRPALHTEQQGHRIVLGDWDQFIWLGVLEQGNFKQLKVELKELLTTVKDTGNTINHAETLHELEVRPIH